MHPRLVVVTQPREESPCIESMQAFIIVNGTDAQIPETYRQGDEDNQGINAHLSVEKWVQTANY